MGILNRYKSIEQAVVHSKNKFNKSKYLLLANYTDTDASGYKHASISLKPNTTYKVSIVRYFGWTGSEGGVLLISGNATVAAGYTSIANVSYPNINNSPYTTGADGLLYIGYHPTTTQTQMTNTWDNTNVQIEEGTVATAYVPYF